MKMLKARIALLVLFLQIGFISTGQVTIELDPQTTIRYIVDNNTYYRIVATGFICNRETYDDAFERDGKRDEIYLTCQSHISDVNGVIVPGTAVQHRTRVMGDIHRRDPGERRVMAGSASDLGGIRTGDQIPDPEPFKNNAPPTGDLLPFILWEGKLANGQKAIINPNIFEWDGPADFFTSFWHESFVGMLIRPAVGLASLPFRALGVGGGAPYSIDQPGVWAPPGLVQQMPNVFYKIQLPPSGAANYMEVVNKSRVDCGRPNDRPIGTSQGDLYFPLLITLTAADAGRLAGMDNGYGRGVFPLYFKDHGGLNGDYILFIRVEIVTDPAQQNRINLTSTDVLDLTTSYAFRNVNASDKEADILNGGRANNTYVVLNDLKGLSSQRWKLRKANNEYYYINNNFNNGCLDLLNKNNINGSNIVTSACDGSNTQQWWFIRYCDGSWLVRNLGTGRVMEVYNSATNFAAPLGQWDTNNGKNQRWFIEKK